MKNVDPQTKVAYHIPNKCQYTEIPGKALRLKNLLLWEEGKTEEKKLATPAW